MSAPVTVRPGLRTQVHQIFECIGDDPEAYGITADELAFLNSMRMRNIAFGTQRQAETGQRIYDKVFSKQEVA